MALNRDVYRELEDILGPENVSEDLAVLEGYAFQGFSPRGPKAEDRYYPRPGAVVLPGSTEEVQAIMRLCNRRRITSKAFGTGYGGASALGGEGMILLDLRRMNRILELDEKNMYVVVEPYATFGQIQAEAMKRGLNCEVITAGTQCSYLASHAVMEGPNSQAVSYGYPGRNLLAVEWVLPTGEILTLGSAGSGAGWFSGDGSGPSLRGIVRGAAGTRGGLGVFTKCAGHLHPWPGPPELEVKGISPEYEAEVPPLFEYHILEFPTWEQFADAEYKIGEAGIALALHKAGGPGSHGQIVTTSNNEYWEKRQKGELLVPKISLAIIMGANSPAEHDYQVKVLDKILADTGGKISPVGEDPAFKKRDYLQLIMACFTARLTSRAGGGLTIDGLVSMDTVDNCALAMKTDEPLEAKYQNRGQILTDGTHNTWQTSIEGSHIGHAEGGHLFGGFDEEGWKGHAQMLQEGLEIAYKTPFSFSWMGIGGPMAVGPHCYDYHNWMRKIKRTFDPNTVSDPKTYISSE